MTVILVAIRGCIATSDPHAIAAYCTTMKPAAGETTFDFASLAQAHVPQAGRHLRTQLWLLGFLALLVASVVALVLYLQNFETEEETRQNIADAQWLEQSMAFHFRRLEDDLRSQARSHGDTQAGAEAAQLHPGGLLWSEPGVLLARGWLGTASHGDPPPALERLRGDSTRHVDNASALDAMQDIARGLRRASYAGPMRGDDGAVGDVIWLAVPAFERGEFVGDYVAAIALSTAIEQLVPPWFKRNHHLRLTANQAEPAHTAAAPLAYLSPMNLTGTDLAVLVTPVGSRPANVPRAFFAVALLFLLGMLASLFALRRDFVKRQRVEAQLQSQVALRRAMENSLTVGLRAWDLQGRILYVNQAFCRIVGYGADELVGRSPPLPYWSQGTVENPQPVTERLIARTAEPSGVELQFQHRDGHVIDVLVHEAPLTAVHGPQLGWMSSVLDISERKQAQRMATRQQERMEASGRLVAIGEVASTLAHELNQPLGALSGFATGLGNRLRAGQITLNEVAPITQRMERLAEKCGQIIQRVNAFAQRRELSPTRVDLVALLRRIMRNRPSPPNAQVDVVLADAPVWVEADALLLEHAVLNLVLNAQHWAHRGQRPARVRIAMGAASGMAGIVVADSGPGIGDDQVEHIFTAFFSARDDSTAMGMGLAICRSVVEAHRGRIDVARDPELGGARFTLWLLLADAPAQVSTQPEEMTS
jgi:two-component system sensor histidine kinase DctS